jgi:hypothetical protein
MSTIARRVRPRRLRLQADQRLDGFRGARLGPRLQQLAEQHQRDDRGPAFEINVLRQPEHRHHRRETPGHAGPQRNQHIHVGTAAPQRLPGAVVKAPADPELHRRRQRQLQPARQLVVVTVLAEHEEHLPDQRQGQQHGDPEALDLA